MGFRYRWETKVGFPLEKLTEEEDVKYKMKAIAKQALWAYYRKEIEVIEVYGYCNIKGKKITARKRIGFITNITKREYKEIEAAKKELEKEIKQAIKRL